jgi:hypothetical protein
VLQLLRSWREVSQGLAAGCLHAWNSAARGEQTALVMHPDERYGELCVMVVLHWWCLRAAAVWRQGWQQRSCEDCGARTHVVTYQCFAAWTPLLDVAWEHVSHHLHAMIAHQ